LPRWQPVPPLPCSTASWVDSFPQLHTRFLPPLLQTVRFLTLRAVCGDIARAAKTECCQEPSSMVLARPTGTGRTQHSRASFFHTQLFYV
jgi:hypothetical protein